MIHQLCYSKEEPLARDTLQNAMGDFQESELLFLS